MLGNSGGADTVFSKAEPGQPLGSPGARQCLPLIELLARCRSGGARHATGLQLPARFRYLPEGVELARSGDVGQVLELKAKPQVWLIASEAGHCLRVRQALKGRFERDIDASESVFEDALGNCH